MRMLKRAIGYFEEELRILNESSSRKEDIQALKDRIESGQSLSQLAQQYEDDVCLRRLYEMSLEQLNELNPDSVTIHEIELALRKIYDPIIMRHISSYTLGSNQPRLELNNKAMLLGVCQIMGTLKSITYIGEGVSLFSTVE